MIPEPAKGAARKVAEYAAFFAVFATIGSYWINTEVERRMGELAPDPGAHPVVVTNTTRLDGLEAGQERIEGKVDAFSREFLKYLERQSQ
jgi:hypothetical protein